MLRHRLGLLTDRDYRALFACTTVGQLGRQVSELALPLIAVLALSASEFEVGLLAAMTTMAFLVIGLPAGAWVDRLRRRNVLIVADLARAALLVTVPLAWWMDALTMWQLYAVALLMGVFSVFFDVAYQSYLPHLVGREHLVEGNAKLESVRAVSHIGGPALGGQLIQALTAPIAVLADAVALAASVLFLVGIRKPEPKPVRRPDSHLLREIGEGMRFVTGQPLLRRIVMCTGWHGLCFSTFWAMALVFLARDLGVSPGVIGLLLSASGVGALVGAFVARRFAAWVGQGPAIWMSVAFSAPFSLLLPLAQPGWRLWLAGAGQFVIGAGVVVYNVSQVSFRQAITPDHLLGRMNATIRFFVWGTIPIGGILGGVLGELVGARTTIWIGSIAGCLAFVPVFLSPLRSMRSLPTGENEPQPVG
ncbi:MAG TPA: MFS transporter [Candidatus Limnocylindrales bacterium]